jgi:outer membrane lipoprotein-sorting protein
MRFLRTTSTARLLALVLGAAVVAAGTAAIALAATSGGGQKPPPESLAKAVHNALTAPKVDGVTARIKFTNHLIDSSAVTGSTPLISGATGRLWASSDGRVRIELQSTSGDAQLISDGKSFLVYDGSSNTAYTGQVPQHQEKQKKDSGPPSLARIQKGIDNAKQHAGVSGAIPTTVAGQSAYEVRITPQHGGLVSGARLAWDAIHGVPLEVAVYARGNTTPVLALTAQSISFGKVAASTFAITPPEGAHVVDLTPRHGNTGRTPLSFTPSAPTTLVDNSRRQVKHLGSDGVLVTYGQGLDGIAVFEKKSDGGPQQPQQQGDNGLSLPTVSINGTTAQELPTALGTVVRFTRGGVEYTVVESQPADTVIAAARAL